MVRLLSYLSGSWLSGEGTPSILVDPSTEEPMAQVQGGGLPVLAALDHARRVGLPALSALSFGERATLLQSMAKVLHAQREALLDLSQQNGGNTRGDAKFDVDGAIGTLSAYAAVGQELAKRVGERRFLTDSAAIQLTREARYVGQHVYVPRPGVAVHINAFNFPAWGTFEKVATAFLAGVPVITKPATATALVTFRMVEILVEAGVLPAGSLQLICGGVGELLDHLGPLDHLAFTGGSSTGLLLRSNRNLLRNAARVNVEADSLNAAVLGPDVAPGSDLWRTMVRTVRVDQTQKTGQKCTAIRRVFVPEAHLEAFGADLVEALDDVVVGNPLANGVTMGPVSTATQLRDGLAGIERLAAEGRVLRGGSARVEGVGAPAGKGYFMQPTVLEVADGQAVHELEVFGPVVSLIPYDGSAPAAAGMIARGQGSLVSTAASDDRSWLETFALASAPYLGRMLLLSKQVAEKATPPGMVLPSLIHGGPGRAGGGEELGGERGLLFYMQRTAIAGDRVIIGKHFGEDKAQV